MGVLKIVITLVVLVAVVYGIVRLVMSVNWPWLVVMAAVIGILILGFTIVKYEQSGHLP
jgi:hypothetical protein